MSQYASNMLKNFGRKQWCFVVILSAFTLMGSGDSYHHDIEGRPPVSTEQPSLLALLDHLSVFDLDLNEGGSHSASAISNDFHSQYKLQLFAQNHKIKTAYEQASLNATHNALTIFFPKKIPSSEIEDEPANL